MKAAVCVCVVIGAALVLALGAPPASALDVLIADDYFGGDLDHLVTALTGHSVTHLDNTDPNGDPVYTEDASFMADFDVVLFRASGESDGGREITAAEQTALEAYIQGGGSLVATGYDSLTSGCFRLADVVRSSTYGDLGGYGAWTAASADHFILNGPFGDFRGQNIVASYTDMDRLTADTGRGAVSLGRLDGWEYDKIIFTDLQAPGGSVGMWNGNGEAADWDPNETDGDKGLDILRNWLAGLADADGDGVFDDDDNCPNDANPDQADSDDDGVGDACDDCPGTASDDPVDVDGCSTADDDDDGVLNDADNCADTPSCATVDADGCPSDSDGDGVVDGCDDCADTPEGAAVDASGCPPAEQEPQGCCGTTGPVAPLGLAIGMLLLSRFAGYRGARRR